MDMGWRHTLRGRAWALWGIGLLLSAAAAGWAHLDWRARVALPPDNFKASRILLSE